MFIILKHITEIDGTPAKNSPLAVVDSHSEVFEFSSIDEAKYIRDILQVNSKSGRNTYIIEETVSH
jgi:hypothetical protein